MLYIIIYVIFVYIVAYTHRYILWAIFNDNFDCVQFSTYVLGVEISPYRRDGNLSVFV